MIMFLALGVALSTIFTANVYPTENVTPHIYFMQPTAQNFFQGQYYDVDVSDWQVLRYRNSNLQTYLTSINSYEGEYDTKLFSLDLIDNDVVFKNYIEVWVNYEVRRIQVATDVYVSMVYNPTFSVEYMDYDYEFPFLNYYTRAYISQINGNYYSGRTLIEENDFHPLWIGETWSYYEYEGNWNGSVTFDIDFHWLPFDVFNNALEGAYDDGTGSGQIYQNGYTAGLSDGEKLGYDNGYSDGKSVGEQLGYSDGYSDALDQGATASIIFNGIISVGLLPVNVFLRMLNFEVFGINIGAFVSSLLTICVIIIIMRMFLGGKSGSE